jgi:alpha-galactosidase
VPASPTQFMATPLSGERDGVRIPRKFSRFEPLNLGPAVCYEVGAFYDNTSRNGLVVGSVTHDTWKTGIYFYGANNNLNQLNVYGGTRSSWDVMPHGSVSGNIISSPTVY